MKYHEDEDIPDSGQAKIAKPKGFKVWLVQHSHWRARGKYLCADGYWRDWDGLGPTMSAACFTSRALAEEALAKAALLGDAAWRPTEAADVPERELDAQSRAQMWLLGFCARYGADYEDLVKSCLSGEGYCFGDDDGPEAARREDFWENLRLATGQDSVDPENTYFRCAC